MQLSKGFSALPNISYFLMKFFKSIACSLWTFVFVFSVFTEEMQAQLHFYESTFNGGVTSGGWSPQVSGTGTGNFEVFIEPGSTIHAAFIIASRLGPGDGIVNLNGIDYPLNILNQTTGPFPTLYGDPSAVHVVEVTTDLDPNITNFQISGGAPYQDFQLVVFYENPLLSLVTGAIFLNTVNLIVPSSEWILEFDSPIVNAEDVALCFFNSYQCDNSADAENITVNGNFIGTTGSQDSNSEWCTGTIGSFYYQNAIVYALGDDNVDQTVNGSEALSDAAELVPNGSDEITVLFEHVSGNTDNHQWSIVAAYGSTCQAEAPEIVANSVCLGENISFSETSGNAYSSWNWNFDDNSTSNLQNPDHTYSESGEYNVILNVMNSEGCINSLSLPVTVYPLPDISVEVTGGCNNDEYTLTAEGADSYVWNPGDFTSNEITVNINQPTTFQIVGNNVFECQSIFNFDFAPIEPMEIELEILSNPTCENPTNGAINVNTTGGLAPFTYVWSPLGSASGLNENLESGLYSVTIIDARGCSYSSEVLELISTGLPNVVISGPTFLCPGETITLTASGANNYEWSTGETDESIEVSPEVNTTYSVIGYNGLCESSASAEINVNNPAIWNLADEYFIELGQSIQLNAGISGIYEWYPTTGLSCSNCQNLIASPNITTLYTVTFTDAESGCTTEHLVLINVEVVTLFIPNVVTLTEDDFNETFHIVGGPFREPLLKIFNRWGNLLFETSDPLRGWNLKINGERAPSGTYYYFFQYDSLSGTKQREGHFTIIGMP
jgi:gliding motility-associated-like protein